METIIGAIPERKANALRAAMRYPADSAGTLMDPRAVALPGDMVVGEAFKEARREAGHARFDVFVVDREHRSTGVTTLGHRWRRLPGIRWTRSCGRRTPLSPGAGRRAIAAHAGWRDVILPVLDEEGRFLGALHYPVSREIEDGSRRRGPDPERPPPGRWATCSGPASAASSTRSPPPPPPHRTPAPRK